MLANDLYILSAALKLDPNSNNAQKSITVNDKTVRWDLNLIIRMQ